MSRATDAWQSKCAAQAREIAALRAALTNAAHHIRAWAMNLDVGVDVLREIDAALAPPAPRERSEHGTDGIEEKAK